MGRDVLALDPKALVAAGSRIAVAREKGRGPAGQQVAKLLASDGGLNDELGYSVAISGNTALVGSKKAFGLGIQSGSAYVFQDLEASSYCSATPNSTGAPASITACGSNSIAANNLTLSAGPVPNTFHLFLYGSTQVQVPLGNGFLCTEGGYTRLQHASMATGNTASRAVDVPLAIGPVGTYNFQCWYRDNAAGGAGFNLSDALSISFVP